MISKSKSNWLKNLLLVFGSCVVTLLMGEVLARIIVPQNKQITWLEMHPEGFMMNQSSGSAFQEFGEIKAEYRFTKDRLRGSEYDKDKMKILTLGDSFTFGLLLNEEDTYIQKLQTKIDSVVYDSVAILNGGVGGAGLADFPGWLQNFGAEIDPDYVILFLNYNDVERALSKNLYVIDPEQKNVLIKTQRWKPRKFMFSLGQTRWYRWLQANSDLMNIVVKLLWKFAYFEDLTSDFSPQKTEAPIATLSDYLLESTYSLELSKLIVNEMDNWCYANNCTFILATTGFFDPNTELNHTNRFYNWLKENPQEYLFYDISPCVLKGANGNLKTIQIPEDSHPNKKGAKIISECTWQWLSIELE